MNRKLRSVIGIGATTLLLVSGATQAVTLAPLFTFPNGLSGGVQVTNFNDANNKFNVELTGLVPTAAGPALWQVVAPVTFTGGDYARGPGVFDPSPPAGWDPNDPLSGWNPMMPSSDAVFFPAGPVLIFSGQDNVTTNLAGGVGFTVDLTAGTATNMAGVGTTITRDLMGTGIGLDYVMPGIPFPFVPLLGVLAVDGDLITEITALAAGAISLEVTDNTMGNIFINQLQLLDGPDNPGVIDGPFLLAEESGKYIPEPPMLALMGLGLLPLIRRRLKAA